MSIITTILLQNTKSTFSKEEYENIKKESNNRYIQLCDENKDIPKALNSHVKMVIFPSIAVYETLIQHGMDEDKTVDFISATFVKLCGMGFKFKSLQLHLFGSYHRYPQNFVKNSIKDFSPESGFQYELPKESNPAIARFDIVKCPYHDFCMKYNCLKLNRAFCDSDDAKYGNLHPKLLWRRTGTLGKGNTCCDFLIMDTSRVDKK